MADRTGAGTGPAAYLVNLALRALIGLVRLLPYRWRVPAMGWAAAHLVAPLAGWRRRIRANLAYVFPEMPEAEVRRLVRAVPDNAGRALMETYSAEEFAERIAGARLTGPGAAALLQARDQGRPAVLVTGHFGNYEAPRAWLIRHGFRIGGLYRPMRNQRFNAHYVAALSSIGTPLFPRGRDGLGQMVRWLKSGGMIGMVIDQHMEHGTLLDFLGRPAPTALSAAELAVKYGALLVPVYGVRRPDGLDFDLVVEAPLEGRDPVALTQALNDSLAAMVRAHMDQWLWIHRRWKPERRQGESPPPAAIDG